MSVKNSAEYEELRRILFHPINPVQSYYNPNTSSRALLVNAEVYWICDDLKLECECYVIAIFHDNFI